LANRLSRLRQKIRSSKLVRSAYQLVGRAETLRDLPYILDNAKPNRPLAEKIVWLEQLMEWIRSGTTIQHEFDDSIGQLHTVRVRFLLQLLERNPHWKIAVAEMLRAIILETSAVQLFCQTGLTQESGFFSEGANRILKRILPVPPRERELSEIFEGIFRAESDATWIKNLSEETYDEIIALIIHEQPSEINLFLVWSEEIVESLLILGSSVAAQGVGPEIRSRLPGTKVNDLPFVILNRRLGDLASGRAQRPFGIEQFASEFQPVIDECRMRVHDVLKHLEVSGVSVNLVYRLESLSNWLSRIETLLQLLTLKDFPDRRQIVLGFVSNLVSNRLDNSSITHLIQGNLHLLSRKIVERTGASGEHYITRTRSEYMQMFQSAMGGGLLTVGTTILKFAVSNMKPAPFFEALFLTVNYAGSFMLMQVLGFTLATKQPSMTASALAGRLKDISKPDDVNNFVTEVIRITRSQFIAAVGNVGMVIPGAIFLELAIRSFFGRSVISPETAHYVVHSLDPVHSLTIPFAFLTGIILWVSSLCAGWIENWVVFRQIPEAIAQNRRLAYVFGADRADKLAKWFLHNISGFGGSISLGFFLGSTTVGGRFFGIPLDVRHVTLSSGALAFAVCSLINAGQASGSAIALAALGIVFIGILNFGVSFALALLVAARARNVRLAWLWYLAKIVWTRLKRTPREFFLPPRDQTKILEE
jgi:site-specific recombinase